MGYRDRLDPDGKKKLLALDGGGIRGVLTIEVLAEIEKRLQQKLGDQAVLGDYFDYIGGTSTGAIIAAGLAVGMRVEKIRSFYEDKGEEMFDKAFITNRLKYLYASSKLKQLLMQTFGKDTTFGDESLKCLLMMVMRNASTDSPWPLSNNPEAKYNAAGRSDCNLKLPLWQLVRASTAAPVYFEPELIHLPGDPENDIEPHDFVFVDGGVTMYNNPAFQLFLMATLAPYKLNWNVGVDKMLLVSVGTGTAPKANDKLRPEEMNILYNAKSVPAALMSAALNEQDLLCRAFGHCLHGAPIDREVGDLADNDPAVAASRLFAYVRYNAELTERGLKELGLEDIDPTAVQQLDSVANIKDLQRIGRKVALTVQPEHFDGF